MVKFKKAYLALGITLLAGGIAGCSAKSTVNETPTVVEVENEPEIIEEDDAEEKEIEEVAEIENDQDEEGAEEVNAPIENEKAEETTISSVTPEKPTTAPVHTEQKPVTENKPVAETKPQTKPETITKPENVPENKPTTETKPEIKPEVVQGPSVGEIFNGLFKGLEDDFTSGLGESDATMIEDMYGLDFSLVEDFKVMQPLMSGRITEVAVFKVKDSSNVAKVAASCQSRLDYLRNGGAWYPSHVDIVTDYAEIVTVGNYVLFVADEACETIIANFKALV
jgi:hypothetical protein